MKKSIDAIDVGGLHTFVRLDLNVPLTADRRIEDERRIVAALPTVTRLLQKGGRVILASHLGRPGQSAEDRRKYSLAPVASRLSELLEVEVPLLPDCVGGEVAAAVDALPAGSAVLLENLRFHSEETIRDSAAAADPALREAKDRFARSLSGLADVYVNDAFGTCHRDNASILTLPRLMEGKPRVVGLLVRKELRFLGEAMADPARPFVCILGGAKVSDKLELIHALLRRCDTILVGGAMAYTFLAAAGHAVGASLVEPELLDAARSLQEKAGGKLRLPCDAIAAPRIEGDGSARVCSGEIPNGLMGLDIGPETVKIYCAELAQARTVFWNGPMGVFEVPPFDSGTKSIAAAVAQGSDRGCVTVVGGGDSAAALHRAGLADRITHVSTGGGASLEFLAGKPFAALDVLEDE